jgi:hypothetical protein
VLFVLSLVAVILVGSYGDCKYYAKGCHWVADCGLIGLARGFCFYLLLLWLGWWWRGW